MTYIVYSFIYYLLIKYVNFTSPVSLSHCNVFDDPKQNCLHLSLLRFKFRFMFLLMNQNITFKKYLKLWHMRNKTEITYALAVFCKYVKYILYHFKQQNRFNLTKLKCWVATVNIDVTIILKGKFKGDNIQITCISMIPIDISIQTVVMFNISIFNR